eukprot:TRINITY_DN79916_c0_g1_i1.p1 TRINITY_DN79916_c0_g1~~TRINITY_DN79916_c0_g1_i1.p1  ORF type:complete len:513 (+),score=138.90 TRINITY_DN79916_c0_g1_i1:98-1636(+)
MSSAAPTLMKSQSSSSVPVLSISEVGPTEVVISPMSDISTSDSYAAIAASPDPHAAGSQLKSSSESIRLRSASANSDEANTVRVRGGLFGSSAQDDDDDSDDDGNVRGTIAEEDDEKSVSVRGSAKVLRPTQSSNRMSSNGTSGESSEYSRTRTNSEVSGTGSSSGNVLMKIDQHGRLVAHSRGMSSDKQESKESVKLYNERLLKWMSMIKHWDRYLTTDKTSGKITAVSSKLRSRSSKGVPDAVRSTVYLKLLETDVLKVGRENLFDELNQKKKIGTGPWDEIIRRDLHRTNPDHIMFMNKEGAGQEALFRVLRAYSLYDEEVGYCQGMGFFVSVMLTYVPEEDAFWSLVGLFSKCPAVREFYLPNMIGLRRAFFVFQKLLGNMMPKLSKHLDKNDFSAPIYASRWFGTLCADFPIDVTLRIWDLLVLEGPRILFQVGLAIMKKCKKELKNSNFDEFMHVLREAQRSVDADELIQEALKINVRQKDVDSYGKKFDEIESKLGAMKPPTASS